MSAYVVTYDLDRPEQNYPGLIERLKAYGTCWHFQQSCWIVASANSAFEVAENLRQELDSGDVLFVQALTEDSAWWGYDDPDHRVAQWMKTVLQGW
jgi:hypothetical protein